MKKLLKVTLLGLGLVFTSCQNGKSKSAQDAKIQELEEKIEQLSNNTIDGQTKSKSIENIEERKELYEKPQKITETKSKQIERKIPINVTPIKSMPTPWGGGCLWEKSSTVYMIADFDGKGQININGKVTKLKLNNSDGKFYGDGYVIKYFSTKDKYNEDQMETFSIAGYILIEKNGDSVKINCVEICDI